MKNKIPGINVGPIVKVDHKPSFAFRSKEHAHWFTVECTGCGPSWHATIRLERAQKGSITTHTHVDGVVHEIPRDVVQKHIDFQYPPKTPASQFEGVSTADLKKIRQRQLEEKGKAT